MKMDIDRHGPRPMPNSCKNLNPPNFSLPTTFKMYGLMCNVRIGLIADSKFGFKYSASTLWPGLMLGYRTV
jgi:hypothetical protein